MRCLVTGGAGFIGSHLVDHLLSLGHQVRVLDNLDSGKLANLEAVSKRIEFVEGDVRELATVQKAVADRTHIFHLAAMVSVPKSVKEPQLCHEICATGTLNVLMAAAEANVNRVVYAASSSCYGDPQIQPINEQTPVQALSPYAAGKLAGEHYCTAFANVTQLETVRCRFFNVYGPRQDPSSPYSGVISIFATKMLANQRPTIYGDGLQTRDFVYVKDVVQALYLASTTPGVSGKVFNVGTGDAITVLKLAEHIARTLKVDLTPILAEPRAGDVRHSVADLTAIKQALKFDPKVKLADGLKECLEFYRQG